MPRPNPDLNTNCGKNTNTWNVNVTPDGGTLAGMHLMLNGEKTIIMINGDETVDGGGGEGDLKTVWRPCPKNNCVTMTSLEGGWTRYCFEKRPPQPSSYMEILEDSDSEDESTYDDTNLEFICNYEFPADSIERWDGSFSWERT